MFFQRVKFRELSVAVFSPFVFQIFNFLRLLQKLHAQVGDVVCRVLKAVICSTFNIRHNLFQMIVLSPDALNIFFSLAVSITFVFEILQAKTVLLPLILQLVLNPCPYGFGQTKAFFYLFQVFL